MGELFQRGVYVFYFFKSSQNWYNILIRVSQTSRGLEQSFRSYQVRLHRTGWGICFGYCFLITALLSCNLYTAKFSLLKYTAQCFVNIVTELCSHHQYLILEHFQYPKENLFLKLRYNVVLYISYVTPWHSKIISASPLPNYETSEMG